MTKAEKTKQFIIEKTAPVFNTKGYAGTSLSDITDATGLTKGSIYGNFANKDEVALSAFDHNWQQVKDIIAGEMSNKTTVKEKLLVYVYGYQQCLQRPFPYGGCPILNTAIEADDTHPQLRRKASDAIAQWKGHIVHLVNKGIENGELNPATDAQEVALSIIAMIEGGIMIAKVTGNNNYKEIIMRSLEKIINALT